MNKKTLIGGIIFFIIGAGVLIGDSYIIKNTLSFLNNSEKTEGIVTDIVQSRSSDSGNYMYSPEVSFVDNSGKTISFTSNISSSVPTYRIGEKIPVIYNKENSQEAKINTLFQLWFGPALMTVLGIIFFLIGFFTLIKQIKKSTLKKELLSRGTKISVKVTSIESPDIRSGFSYGGNIPNKTYQIVAQWLNPTDNKMYVFKSDDLTYNPESIILNKEIFVYIDPINPQKYYIDISTLPTLAN